MGVNRPFVFQIFCSALCVSYQPSVSSRHWVRSAPLVLEATYEATMSATLLNAKRSVSNVVFLTFLNLDSPDEMALSQLRAPISISRSNSYAGSSSRILTDPTGERRSRRFRQHFRDLRSCRARSSEESGLNGEAFGNEDIWIHSAIRHALTLAANFDLDGSSSATGCRRRQYCKSSKNFADATQLIGLLGKRRDHCRLGSVAASGRKACRTHQARPWMPAAR